MQRPPLTTAFGAPVGLPAPEQLVADPHSIEIARRCLAAMGALGIASTIGVAFSLYLINAYPLTLIALSPIGRHLMLVAPMVDPVAFVVVAVLRRLAFYAPCFVLGRSLGPGGVAWLEGRASWAARVLRWLQALFDRAAWPAVFFLPGPMMSTIAGMSGMPARVFATLAVGGLVFRMVLTLYVAQYFIGPIEWMLALISEVWLPGTAVMLTGVLAFQWWRARASA